MISNSKIGVLLFTIFFASGFVSELKAQKTKSRKWHKPNVLMFNADDMGYGDLSSFGHPTQEWGPVDDLALEGMRFTNMYTSASLCTPSRAGLMTGRMPVRLGLYGTNPATLRTTSRTGLQHEEITIAEALKDAGYLTGFAGKWHLGLNAHNRTDGTYLPHRHGFDIVGHHMPLGNRWTCDDVQLHLPEPDPFNCFVYKNDTLVQQPVVLNEITSRMVDDAKDFLRMAKYGNRPFFYYFALPQTHTAMFHTPGFLGTSRRGLYGDNMREMSWAVGSVVEEMKRLGMDMKTLVIFMSDHGPQITYCNEGGDSGIFKGSKGQYWDGGVRIPGIFRWPGQIRPGTTCNKLISNLDLFPTLVSLAGGQVPDDVVLDGIDVSSLFFTCGVEDQPEPRLLDADTCSNPRDVTRVQPSNPRILLFYCTDKLFAVRYGSYKFHFYTSEAISHEQQGAQEHCGDSGFPFVANFDCMNCQDCLTQYDPPLMYNVDKDPKEAYPLNTTLSEHNVVLNAMMVKLTDVLADVEIAPSLLNDKSDDVKPCCSPETYPDCSCNYSAECSVLD